MITLETLYKQHEEIKKEFQETVKQAWDLGIKEFGWMDDIPEMVYEPDDEDDPKWDAYERWEDFQESALHVVSATTPHTLEQIFYAYRFKIKEYGTFYAVCVTVLHPDFDEGEPEIEVLGPNDVLPEVADSMKNMGTMLEIISILKEEIAKLQKGVI